MVQAVALTTVRLCVEPGETNEGGKIVKRAKHVDVPPGETFECDEDVFADLKKAGAANLAGIEAAEGGGDDVDVDNDRDEGGFDTMSKADLLAEAEELGVDVAKTATKAEIIDALNKALEA